MTRMKRLSMWRLTNFQDLPSLRTLNRRMMEVLLEKKLAMLPQWMMDSSAPIA